jgi:hypothetical protein
MGEKAERKGFQADGQAGIRGGQSAAVLRSGAARVAGGGTEAKAAALWPRGKRAWDNLGRCKGANSAGIAVIRGLYRSAGWPQFGEVRVNTEYIYA